MYNPTLPKRLYEEQDSITSDQSSSSESDSNPAATSSSQPSRDLTLGLMPAKYILTLVMGVVSDTLFPAWQQREIANILRRVGNRSVTHVELGEDRSLFGHDTFLFDLDGSGGEVLGMVRGSVGDGFDRVLGKW